MTALFSIAYLPPLSYIHQCIEADKIIIDQHEHFIKQTFRNRCQIYGPNGIQSLIIPIKHHNLSHSPVKDTRISFDVPWNKIHWKTICSAYRNSPFFEFYENEFKNTYEKPDEFLIDFNYKMLEIIFNIFNLNKTITLSVDFEKAPTLSVDFRNTFHPKKKIININPYHQVFSGRFGFINDLSCIDYLFNVGSRRESRIKSQEPRQFKI